MRLSRKGESNGVEPQSQEIPLKWLGTVSRKLLDGKQWKRESSGMSIRTGQLRSFNKKQKEKGLEGWEKT